MAVLGVSTQCDHGHHDYWLRVEEAFSGSSDDRFGNPTPPPTCRRLRHRPSCCTVPNVRAIMAHDQKTDPANVIAERRHTVWPPHPGEAVPTIIVNGDMDERLFTVLPTVYRTVRAQTPWGTVLETIRG
jgi:hypothetical protein